MRNTDLIEIRVFSDDPSEAAKLANAIAESYREYRSSTIPAEIVDKAVPGLRPVRPNKPLNIALGILGGMLLALVAGAGMAGLVAWIGQKIAGDRCAPGNGCRASSGCYLRWTLVAPRGPSTSSRAFCGWESAGSYLFWRWARICLGVEGVLFLIHYYFRLGPAPPQVPAWVSVSILRLGWLLIVPIPYIPRWVFILLALASICALLWPRKATAPNPC